MWLFDKKPHYPLVVNLPLFRYAINIIIREVTAMPVSDFSFLYLDSYPYLYRLVASIAHNSGLVEDILQEIYLTAWEQFRAVTPPNPYGWLIITARHKTHDIMRRRFRETQTFIPLEDDFPSTMVLPSLRLEPMTRWIERETRYQNIRRHLNEEELMLLIAYYDKGFTVTDISRRLNISDSACYMRLHRARKKLEPLRA